MATLIENIINAIKGKYNNEANRVYDDKVYQAINNLDFNLEIQDNKAKSPYPAKLFPTHENGGLIIKNFRTKAIDRHGNLYATTSVRVLKQDAGTAIKKTSEEWLELWEVPDVEKYGHITVSALMVTNTNRLIVPTQKGYVFVSDENQEVFEEANIRFNFDLETNKYAYTHYQFGYGHYENIVWLAGYAENPVKANKSFISTDYGVSWRECADIPILSEGTNMHIHDMQYDPYADRFWIVNGDQENCNIYYSDDYSESWETVFGPFSEDVRNTQLTSIACYPHGVLFGSDHAVDAKNDFNNNHMEDSIRYWKRTKGERQAEVNPDDIKIIYRPYKDNKFRCFALRVHQIEINGDIITLMPFYGIGDDNKFLLASNDGLSWYEIYRGHHTKGWQLAGVTEIDGEMMIVGFDRDSDENMCLLNMPMPKWID